jgi:hypothetical protein
VELEGGKDDTAANRCRNQKCEQASHEIRILANGCVSNPLSDAGNRSRLRSRRKVAMKDNLRSEAGLDFSVGKRRIVSDSAERVKMI